MKIKIVIFIHLIISHKFEAKIYSKTKKELISELIKLISKRYPEIDPSRTKEVLRDTVENLQAEVDNQTEQTDQQDEETEDTTKGQVKSCYDVYLEDEFDFEDEDYFANNSSSHIYFIESSCNGNLNVRQACSIESAARAHPNRYIIVFFIGPTSRKILYKPVVNVLSTYKNVFFFRIRLNDYVKDTPFEPLVLEMLNNNDNSAVYNIANVLKYTTLYKYGGIALDLDVLVVKPFDSLPVPNNFIGVESHIYKEIGTGVIGISMNKVGRMFISAIINYQSSLSRNAEVWRGSGVAEMALERICGLYLRRISRGVTVMCQGIAIYEEDVFYPVYYDTADSYFGNSLNVDHLLKSYALHTYDSITKKYPITEDSTYAKLMKLLCPRVENRTIMYSN